VTVVGHSLGAGVASLLSLLLKDRGLKPGTLRSVAYEPPACMDLALAEACAEDGLVTSLVTRDDVVPRLAPGPFAALLKQLASFDWKAEAKRDDQGTPPVLVAMQRLSGLFGSTAPGDAPSDDGSDSDGSISSKGSLHQPGYNPYVPGRIMYFSPSSEDGGGEAVKVMVPPTSPVLRRIRITSCMLSDHFIDGKEISAVLDAS